MLDLIMALSMDEEDFEELTEGEGEFEDDLELI